VLAAAGGVGIAAIQIAKGRHTRSFIRTFPRLFTSASLFPLTRTPKALGARVIAAASPNKLDVARIAGGADVVVDYTTDDWQKYVMHITGGRGVDVVYDPVGRIKGSCLPQKETKTSTPQTLMGSVDALKCIAWGGRALVVGFAGGAIEQVCPDTGNQNVAPII
jgi:threonine dehydrogenase-like Zn-dependent dehydrogenase